MNEGKPDDLAGNMAAKAEKLAADALEAGKKFIETDTGKKVAEATESAFQTASEMGQKIADSEFGKKALESDIGKQAVEFAKQAGEQTKANIPNVLGRNVAVGAAAGAVVAIPIPFIGPFIGAVIGAGLGYLRTVTKKN
jgi:hypothetical protein